MVLTQVWRQCSNHSCIGEAILGVCVMSYPSLTMHFEHTSNVPKLPGLGA